MKYVRLDGANTVQEIIPDAATQPSIAFWYGEDFAATCVQAPDDVQPNMVYDAGTFTLPPPPPPAPPTLDDRVAQLEQEVQQLAAALAAMAS
jgi:hypothetical protein